MFLRPVGMQKNLSGFSRLLSPDATLTHPFTKNNLRKSVQSVDHYCPQISQIVTDLRKRLSYA